MKIPFHLPAGLLIACLLASCTTPTRRHMREADALLLRSEEKMAEGDLVKALALAEQAGLEVKAGVAARPVRKGAGGDPLDMTPLLEAWSNGPHGELLSALRARQIEPAVSAFVATRQQCTNCHVAAGRVDIPISTRSQR